MKKPSKAFEKSKKDMASDKRKPMKEGSKAEMARDARMQGFRKGGAVKGKC
jgi:hypothetical protein